MTPVQGEPPKIDFRLPKKLKAFLNALRQFAIQTQPIDGPGVKLSQYPRGRLLSVDQAFVSNLDATAVAQLECRRDADEAGKVRLYAGVVAGQNVAETLTATATDGDEVYVSFAVQYSTGTGTWSLNGTTRTVGIAAITPSAGATTAYVKIADVAVSGGIATPTNIRTGPIEWERRGNGTTYADGFYSADVA